MASYWVKSGKLIVDSNGRAIECDRCPCSSSSSGTCSCDSIPKSVSVTVYKIDRSGSERPDWKFVKDGTYSIPLYSCEAATEGLSTHYYNPNVYCEAYITYNQSTCKVRYGNIISVAHGDGDLCLTMPDVDDVSGQDYCFGLLN